MEQEAAIFYYRKWRYAKKNGLDTDIIEGYKNAYRILVKDDIRLASLKLKRSSK